MKNVTIIGLLWCFVSGGLAHAATPRIVGGDASRVGQWQSFVTLANRSDPDNAFCGGTLVAPSWVLTAAHCLDSRRISSVVVATGLYNYSGAGARNAKAYFNVARALRHPKSTGRLLDGYDVILLQLDGVATVKPATLYAGASHLAGNLSTVVGFGDTVAQDPDISKKSQFPSRRLEVTLPIVDNALCKVSMQGIADIKPTQICTGVPEGGKDTCLGDSGGPLYLARAGDEEVVVGVVSYGVGCALPSFYSVNTRVSDVVDFVKAHVSNVTLDTESYGYTLSRELTGGWGGYSRRGEYLNVNMMPDDKIDVHWLTYDQSGKPVHLMGTAGYNPYANIVSIELYQQSQSRQYWGNLTFVVYSCHAASLSYRSSDFGEGTIYLTRLTTANTSNCAGRYDASVRRLSGRWGQVGAGNEQLILQALQGNRVSFSYFFYDDTRAPLTLFGIARARGDRFLGTAYQPLGPKFGELYRAGEYISPILGKVEFALKDCEKLTLSTRLGSGYGNKTRQLERLTHVEGNICTPRQ